MRGIDRTALFRDDTDHANFLDRFRQLLIDSSTPCLAWALMGNHVNLLLRTARVPISTRMRRLLTGFAQQFNRRHRRQGVLFQNRYKSILCEEQPYLLALVRSRVYARGSAGFYEEMYAGAGGQVLYLSRDGGWSADLAVDALRQRGFEGWFGFRDYSTVTAIASLNYRMTQGVTGTLRAGRFLAKDEGVRMELKRRFDSGFEVGAWYTVTNGNDITSPGTPESPYYDKGIFMQVALNTMLTKDTRATANLALAPWTRDVGQMVRSPGDLDGERGRAVPDLTVEPRGSLAPPGGP